MTQPAGNGFIPPIILGGGAVPFRRYQDGSDWRDWARIAATEALRDADIEGGDIDAIVVASESDFFSLQVNPGPVIADDLGLTGCPVVRAEAGGASGAWALRVGLAQVMAGLARRVLVVGFEAAASALSGDDAQLVFGLSFDAATDGMGGATAVALYGLSMSEHMRVHGTTAEQMAAVSVKNHGNAAGNPLAHKPMALCVADVLASPMISTPYRRLDCSLVSDGAAAVILAHPDHAPAAERPRSRITGSGAATDHARLGDRRERHRFTAKAYAATAAYAMAGIRDPLREVAVAEVYDAFSGAEIQGIEALGLAPEGRAASALEAGEFAPDGRLPVNLSGGLIGQGGAPGAVGVMQAVAMDRLLTQRYWPALQPDRDLRTGVIDAHGGVATTSVVHVLERVEP